MIGRKITLHGNPFTVAGVLPRGFNGLNADTSPDIRVPASCVVQTGGRILWAQIYGHLRPGTRLERADSQLEPLLRAAYEDAMHELRPKEPRPAIDTRMRLEGIEYGVSPTREKFSRGLELLMAGVALLLLMACANVAGLLLARSAGRAQELSIRLALGAGRWRIARQLLSESLIVAVAGGIGGVLLAYGCLPLLVRALPPVRDRAAVAQPLAVHIEMEWRVLAFALAATLASAVLCGILPALRSSRANLSGSRVTARLWVRNAIVAAQVAVCTILLIGAALLVETLHRMRTMDAGFDADHVVTFTVDPYMRAYKPEQSRALALRLLEKARALPMVRAAALAGKAMMRGTGIKATFGAAGTRITKNDFLNSSINSISPGYFETMGMRVVTGRDFTWFDRDAKDPPFMKIVNEAFARRFFPGRNPLGMRFGRQRRGRPRKARRRDNRGRERRQISFVAGADAADRVQPRGYGFEYGFILHVRTRGRPEAVIGPVREIMRSLDPELPFVEVATLREEVDTSLWQERLLAELTSIFGAIALLLAGIGLYGALDFAVKSRTREIGVRVALGAAPARIARLLSGETIAMTLPGIALGLLGYALLTAPFLRQVLYEVGAWDRRVAVGSAALLTLGAVIVAALPPIRRAVRVQPSMALRAE